MSGFFYWWSRAVAGDIVANLTANTSQWTSALTGAITPLNALAAGALSFVATAVTDFNRVGSALDDMSQRTGVSVESLSQLSYVAEQTSTSLGSLQSAFIKMSKFMSDVKGGSKDALATLRELGLTAAELEGLPADEQLKKFADALKNTVPPAQQSVMAMKVFGKGAIDLLPMLNQGSAGIAHLVEEADRLGYTMSATAAAAAAEFGDSLDRLKLGFNMLVVAIGSQFAPMLTDLADTFTTVIAENGELIRTTLTIITVFGAVVGAFKLVTLATQTYAKATAFATALASGPAGLVKLGLGLAAAAAATGYLNSTFESMNSSLDSAIEKNTQTAAAVDGVTDSISRAAAVSKSYVSEMESLAEQFDSLVVPATTRLRNEVQKMHDDWFAAVAAGDRFSLTMNQMEGLQLAKTLDVSGWSDGFTSVAEELRVLRGEISETELQFEKMSAFGVDDKRIEILRGAYAERDALKKQAAEELEDKRKKADREKQAAAAISATRNEVVDALMTPAQKQLEAFQNKTAEVKAAIDAGALSPGKGLAFLEAERAKLLAGGEQQKQASNIGVDARSGAANTMLVDLINRRAVPKDKDALALAKATNDVLIDIRDDARKKAELKTKPFSQGGRT